MAKFKQVRAGSKSKPAVQPRAGWPCVVLVILGVLGLFVFLFLVMKYAS